MCIRDRNQVEAGRLVEHAIELGVGERSEQGDFGKLGSIHERILVLSLLMLWPMALAYLVKMCIRDRARARAGHWQLGAKIET